MNSLKLVFIHWAQAKQQTYSWKSDVYKRQPLYFCLPPPIFRESSLKTIVIWGGKSIDMDDKFYENRCIQKLSWHILQTDRQTQMPDGQLNRVLNLLRIFSHRWRQKYAVDLMLTCLTTVSYTHLDVYKRQHQIPCVSL